MRFKICGPLSLLLLITMACAFAVPIQPNAGPATLTATAMAALTEPFATPVASIVTATPISATPTSTPDALTPIVLPISVYILDDTGGQFSSTRTVEQLEEIYEKINEIWAQAGIVIEVQTIQRVTIDPIYLQAIALRDFRRFFDATGAEIEIPDPSLLNAFYAQDIGGPNGITPFSSRAFFVTDFPSVHHKRVSSHEIGHILGLHHVLDDSNRLMFSGTNGVTLSEEEITVTRYAAQGLLDGVR